MKEITFDTFYQLYQNDQLSLVDVREVDEFEALHLEGAHNLPLLSRPLEKVGRFGIAGKMRQRLFLSFFFS